jgi:peptidoglycan-N-acetylglucosamine deacetylase
MPIIPHRIPSLFPKLFPGMLWRMNGGEKKMFLTFDDGPVPGPTEFALETLQKFGAKATFFCIGHNIQKYPEVFHKIVAGGHAVGNHTFNHLSGWSTPTVSYVENVKQCDHHLPTINGRSRRLFRPPYGRLTFGQIKALGQYHIVMWDVLSHDYRQSGSGEQFLKATVAAARTGSIVVFHDSLKAEVKLYHILPRFLDHFSNLGFSFTSL